MVRPTLVCVVVALLAACGGPAPLPSPMAAPPSTGTAPADGYLIRGNLVEAETGQPLSRQSTYLHFFCDEKGFKQSLEPASGAAFEVRVPAPDVRIRAFDASHAHKLFEKTVRLVAAETKLDVALETVPTVLLSGLVVDGATGNRMPFESGGTPGDNGPLFYVHAGEEQIAALLHADAEGYYSIRVPKRVITFSVVDTPKKLRQKTVDLTRVETAEHRFDLVLD